jgi:arylsulfatase
MRYGRVGKQRIEDTGPLTKKRMETCDDEFVAAAKDWIKRQHKAGKPWFCWLNTTHMHLRTHPKPESVGQAGRWQSPYHDTMIDHDQHVGEMLELLDELGIADDTLVMYSTDNGPHMNTWPDGAMTPFRSEKDTNWEGAFRVPLIVRWPGRIEAGVVSNEIVQHHDWLPTFLALAGEPEIVEKCKKGYDAAGKTFKVHLDGYNLMPYLTGEEEKTPREGFIYFDDDGNLVALRYDNWKMVFMEQRALGTLRVWAEPFTTLHHTTHAQTVQPAHRSVRAGGRYLEYLLRLVHRSRLHDIRGPGHSGEVCRDVQAVPAAAESRVLHH